MRVGFDVSPLQAPQGGVGTYTANLLDELRRFPQDEIVPMTQSPVRLPAMWGRSGRTIRVNKTLWMQALLPWQLSQAGADIVHFTNNVASCWTPCPSIVTIHDTTLWLFPRSHPRRRLLAMRPLIPLGAKHARAIIAVSDNTKRDVMRTLQVPADKVHVVYEAPAPHFRPLPRTDALEAVRQRYGLPSAFVLYVGTIEPRKNLRRLFEAFALLRRQTRFSAHGLVLVGHRGWSDSAILSSVERLGLTGTVHLLGYAPAQDLVALYNLAEAVAFPSLYEGFGLPVVEAMACGTPVVASPNGSLAEIAGGAAEMVDPTRSESIAAGLGRVLSDSPRRAELRAAGLRRAAHFSWEAAAAQTRQVYEAVLRG
jgi:glycosyltransferase involved in cell wall biosynthesis